MLTPEEVRHIAKLARLGLTNNEVDKLSGQLTNILDYIKKLDEVDITNVKPTAQITGLENVMREDKEEKICTREELLGCSELPIMQDQIKVKPAITF